MMFPTFGSTNLPSSFNSTVNNMNLPFGQSTSTAPTFGQIVAPNFGTAQNLSSPFVRISNTFGQTIANDQALKNTLFGNNTSNLFGNANKSIFGQQNTIKSHQMETLSNQNPGFKMFENGSSKDQLGTPMKFKPTKDTETLFKGGLTHNLTITYQSLTCMTEYENKSFEELRLEDYQVNRKGAQLAYVVNNPQTTTTSFFNNPTSTNTNFSQPDSLSIFGQSSAGTSFGQNIPIFNNNSMKNTHGGIFVNPTSNFGTNAVSKPNCPFNSNVQSTMVQNSNLFQANTANNPQFLAQNNATFGQSLGFSNQPNFGTNQTNQNTGLFGQSTNFYNQNKAPSYKFSSPLGASTTGQLPGIFSSTTTTAPSLNQLTFGQANQGKLLNIPNNTGSLFFPRQKANSIGGGGYPMPSFGNNETKPSNMFNNFNQISFGSLPNTSLNIQKNSFQNNQVNLNQTVGPEQILNMVTTPYGATTLLNNISSTESELNNYKKITNPEEVKAILKNIEKSKFPTKKTTANKLPIFERKDSVFSGLEFYDEKLIANTRINNNPKRLVIRDNKKNTLDINLLESPIICNDSSESDNECNNSSATREASEHSDSIEHTDCSNEIIEDSNEKAKLLEQIRAEQTENTSICNTESNESSLESVKDTGIVLTRAEYYTVPPVDELVNYVNKDGSCFVQGFTIGRYGYGNVYFPDTFDVSNLNLDELVHFRNKEITIYPDDDTRPDVGHGLNRRAQITLDRVWPRDKITKALITDVDSLLQIDYAKRLRKLCEKQGTRFVEYRPDTGSWVFRVEHF